MTERIEYNTEWAYWIDSISLKLKRLQKSVPIGSIILIKNRGVTEDGKKYVDTDFGIAESSGVRSITKKEASKILAKHTIDYMMKNQRWPLNMEIEEVLKSNDIEILFSASEYDEFRLKITSELVGQKPINFLNSLKPGEKEKELVWRVEGAKSGRSKCRTCGNIIEEGKFRFGEPYLYEDHIAYRWHHAKCIAPLKKFDVERLEGYRLLASDEKLRLKKLLR
ncbi:MAG: PARP-type zinc finger-containing protein [Candidatus Thorarchaeota archaeon]|nr:PARP-type zinc finger-containing protein [Candidatus Thorarchaeota archaeon]